MDITALSWQMGLCNSKKLWGMPCRGTQDGWVIVKSSDKTWFTGGGNGKSLQYSCWRTPWTGWNDKKIWHWKMSPLNQKVSNMLLGKSGGQLLIAPERTKRLGLKQKCLSFVDVSGGESKVQCCKEQYFIGIWNIRSMNQNTDILWISELKWTGMGEFNSDDHCIYYCGKEKGKKWKQWQILFSCAPKSLWMVTEAMKLKDTYSLEGKLWPT